MATIVTPDGEVTFADGSWAGAPEVIALLESAERIGATGDYPWPGFGPVAPGDPWACHGFLVAVYGPELLAHTDMPPAPGDLSFDEDPEPPLRNSRPLGPPIPFDPDWIKPGHRADRKASADAKRAAVVAAYNPNQSRDERGRWSAGGRVGTRYPHAAGMPEVPEHTLTTSMAEIAAQPAGRKGTKTGAEHLAVAAEMMRSNVRGMANLSDDEIVERMADNIVAEYGRAVEHNGDRVEQWQGWYRTANTFARDTAAAYVDHDGQPLTMEMAAGIIARLSPQKDWDMNITLARRSMDAWSDPDPIDADYAVGLNLLIDDANAKPAKSFGAGAEPCPPVKVGQTMRDLTPEQLGIVARFANMERRGVLIVHPSDNEGGYRMTLDRGLATQGQGTLPYTDAARIWRSRGDLDAISVHVGSEHKVRSFFNNIAAPDAGSDITVDTHAYGVAFGSPITTSHPTIASGRGALYDGPDDARHKVTDKPASAHLGTRGVYPLVQEAYVRAADRLGVSPPRAVQSVTWEQWRQDWPPDVRGRPLVGHPVETGSATQHVDRIWARVDTGELSVDQARAEIETVRQAAWREPSRKNKDVIDLTPGAPLSWPS